MIEVELKYAIPFAARSYLEAKLRSARLESNGENIDTYYDTPELDLLRQAVFVRVRNDRKLEFKFNACADVAHVQSNEYSFSLPFTRQQASQVNALFAHFLRHWHEAANWEEMVYANDLFELASIEKTRAQYRQGEMLLCVDRVKDLGDFLEVEVQCEGEKAADEALARIRQYVSDFALYPVHVGYVELWLRLHRPEAYHVGKYQV